ncbi:MAG: hypothetical protein ACOVNR_04265 [Chitinophagaceae bacterium]
MRLLEIYVWVVPHLYKPFTKHEKANFNTEFNKRLISYMFGGYYFSKMFASLHQYTLNFKQRKALYMSGAFLAVGDALFDDTVVKFNHQRILQIIEQPQTYQPQYYKDALLQRIFQLLLANSPEKNHANIKKTLTEAYHANVTSEKQKQGLQVAEEIAKLSLVKGGYCGIYYRSCLAIPYDLDEEKLAYRFGELGQLVDDVLDIQEDRRKGIATMFSNNPDIDALITKFNRFCEESFQQLQQLSFPQKAKDKAIFQYRFLCKIPLFFLLHLKIHVAKNSDISHIELLKYKDIAFNFGFRQLKNLYFEYKNQSKHEFSTQS